jgi:hypothetical protein
MKTEQYVLGAVKAWGKAEDDKERASILAGERDAKYTAWELELLARPVSGREIMAVEGGGK